MLDRLYYDTGSHSWVVETWHDGGRCEPPGHGGEEIQVELTDEQESGLDQRNVYECDTETDGDSIRVVAIGDIYASNEE